MHLLYEIEYKHVKHAERRMKVSVPWGITWNKSIHSKFKEIQFVTSEQIPLKKRLFKYMDTCRCKLNLAGKFNKETCVESIFPCRRQKLKVKE